MQTLFKLAPLILQISIIVQVFAIGLRTSLEDATYLLRRPKLLLNSILARNVAMSIIAIVLIKAFSFHIASQCAVESKSREESSTQWTFASMVDSQRGDSL